MFEQAIQVSQAMREAGQHDYRPLIPALSGCPECETARMIAAPTLGRCEDCGAELTVLGGAAPQPRKAENPISRAA